MDTKRRYVFQCNGRQEMLDAIDFVASDRTCPRDEDVEIVTGNGIRHIATKAQWKAWKEDAHALETYERYLYTIWRN